MAIERLRRQRWTGVRIARQLGLSRATVSRVLRRLGLNRILDLEPLPAVCVTNTPSRRPAAPGYQAAGVHPAAFAPRHRRPPRRRQGHRRRVPAHRHR